MEESLLVLPGTPATVDLELDPVVCGIGRGLAQGSEESWIELGDTRNPVLEDRRAVGEGTARLAERTTVVTASPAKRTRVRLGRDADG